MDTTQNQGPDHQKFSNVVHEQDGKVLTARWGDGKTGKARILVRDFEATEATGSDGGTWSLEATKQPEATVVASSLGPKIEVEEDEF